MIKVKNQKSQSLLELDASLQGLNLEFICSRNDLFYKSKSEDKSLIFYGYLDMKWQDSANPAEFLLKSFGSGLKNQLDQIYGSFIIIYSDSSDCWICNVALGDFLPSFIHQGNVIKISEFAEDLIINTSSRIKVNKNRIAHYFALTQAGENISFYDNIKQMKPGRLIELKHKKLVINKYYSPQIKINYKKIDWANKLNAILRNVIELQCPHQCSLNIQLSGGLDSTLVMAMSLKANKEVTGHSYVFPNFKEADETIWLDSMKNMGLKFSRFVGEPHWPLKKPWFISLNSPMSNPYRSLKNIIYSKVSSSNHKYLLSGVYADHLYTGHVYWLVDALKKRPLFAIKSIFKSFKSTGFITTLKQFAPRKWSSKIRINTSWMLPDLKKNIENELNQKQFNHPHTEQYQLVMGAVTAQSSHLENEWASQHQIHLRNPFRDRRVVEFLLQAPAWVLGDVFNKKKLARQAGNGHLPDSILRRSKTTTLQPMFVQGVLEKELDRVKELLLSSTASWRDYVKKEQVMNLLENPKTKHKESDCLLLWLCISYELWMKRLNNLNS